MPTPFTDPAAGFDNSPLTTAEIERVKEVVRLMDGGSFGYTGVLSYEYSATLIVTQRCGVLSPSGNQAMRYDLDQYFNQVGEGSIEMRGGTDGVRFSISADRGLIRNRVRERLNLSSVGSGGVPLVRA